MPPRAAYRAGPVLGLLAAVQLAGCAVAAPGTEVGRGTDYLGVETRLLDGDLVNLFVSARGEEAKTNVVAYADCAAAQYALISAAASIVGRILSGTTAGALVERFGYVDFYVLTTIVALPGVVLFWWMARSGLVDRSIGSAGVEGEGDARQEATVSN